MNQAMLRQLLWISIISFVKCTWSYVIEPDFNQCSELPCLPVDEIFRNNINFDVEPCDDFSKYACGSNYTSEPPVFALKEMDLNEPEFQDSQDLRKILIPEEVNDNDPHKYIEALLLERRIYKNCLERGTHNIQEMKGYEELIDSTKANRLEPNYHYQTTNEHWYLTDLHYALSGFGFAFFDVDIVERFSGELKRYIQISPTSDDVFELVQLLTIKYMNKSDRSGSGGYSHNVEEKYNRLENFMKQFNLITGNTHRDNHVSELTVAEWQRTYSKHARNSFSTIDWKSLLNSLFRRISQNIMDSDVILIKNENYFVQLARILSETRDMTTIANYIHLRFVSKTIGMVDKEYQKRYSLIPPIEGLVCTPGLFIGTAYAYADAYFPVDNKEVVERMFDRMRNVISKRLGSGKNNKQASSDSTKQFLRQLNYSKILIGYPDWLDKYEDSMIANFYDRNFALSELYIMNQIKCIEMLLINKLRAYRNNKMPIINIQELYNSFTSKNIKISMNLKQIVLPIRIFNENSYKFLSARLYDAINYGAAGTALSTELYYTWFQRYGFTENATACILNQIPVIYDAHDYRLKSIAYLLGMKTAYEAWPDKDQYPIQFPKFGAITDFRVFFLSFAESMCRAQSREVQPYNFLNFVVSNSEEFTEAFQCYKNHTMNRKHKCNPLKYQLPKF